MWWKGKNKKGKKTFKSSKLIRYDALLDTALYKLRSALANFWDNAVILSRYFSVDSFKKYLIDILDESLTLLLIALSLFSISALSILELTKINWQNKRELSVSFLDRYGNEIGARGVIHAPSVPIDELPDYVLKAILATEDRRFFEHIGIDFYGLSRALSQNMRAQGVVQGGSTLTQQVAKNLFLSNERTITRKIKEAFIALWLESNFSKKEILQLYIDNAYMGAGNIGLAAAAKFYFAKDIRDVTLSEAAILAGLFKAPTKYAPHINMEATKARAQTVLENLVNSGYMGAGEVAAAQSQSVHISNQNDKNYPDYFLDWAYGEVQKLADKFTENKLLVHTTLDPNLQNWAQEVVAKYFQEYGKSYNVSQAAIVTLEHNGAIRIMIGGLDYQKSSYNRATQGGRQPGSSFKPYSYAVLMERGLTPQSMTIDAPINWGGWSPNNNNKGRYIGRVDLATALALSINTVPVRLVYQYLHGDTEPIRELIKRMGIDATISKHKTMILGTSNMTPLQQAMGFNVFANGGMAGNCHAIERIVSSQGDLLWDYRRDGPKTYRALSAKASAYMNQMLSQVPLRGSGKRAALDNVIIAGKTGTSQQHRDAWFVGYSGNFTTAVWMGNDNFSPTNRLFGGVVPAMIFHDIMDYAHKNIAIAPLFGVEDLEPLAQRPALKATEQNAAKEIENQLPKILSTPSSQIIKDIQDQLRRNYSEQPSKSLAK